MQENITETTEQLVAKIIKIDETLKELRKTMKKFVESFDRSIEQCYHDISIKIIGTKAITIREDNQNVDYYLAVTGLHLDLVSEEINGWRSHIELADLPPEKMIELIYHLPAFMDDLLEVASTQSLTLTKALLKAKTMMGEQNEN